MLHKFTYALSNSGGGIVTYGILNTYTKHIPNLGGIVA